MSGFDPGPGWREACPAEAGVGREYVVYSDGQRDRYWVREEPAPPLPPEPYAVIRVTWAKGARKGAQDILINHLGGWCDLEGTIYDRRTAAESITGFEVLAEPCAVTAGRIFDRMADLDQQGIAPADVIDRAAAEFGADA